MRNVRASEGIRTFQERHFGGYETQERILCLTYIGTAIAVIGLVAVAVGLVLFPLGN